MDDDIARDARIVRDRWALDPGERRRYSIGRTEVSAATAALLDEVLIGRAAPITGWHTTDVLEAINNR